MESKPMGVPDGVDGAAIREAPTRLETTPLGRDEPAVGEGLTLSYVVAGPGRTAAHVPRVELDERLAEAFAAGRVLQGRYVLERELGRGGMGLVFLGRDRRLDRPVAIKIILAGGVAGQSDDALRSAFEQEARLGANLLHPAIATIFDFGFHDGRPFAVFEHLPGETLRDLIQRRGPLPVDEARLIVGSLAQALDFAHERHVVHRDLKPENVRATVQGHFKLLDLGLARDFRRQADWSFCGTPAYSAPEQAAGLPCDGRADQYALALVVFELLTGRRAFEGSDWISLLDKHICEPPPAPRDLRPDLPDSVSAAILRALAKDPNDRFETCGAFAAALGARSLNAPSPAAEVIAEADIGAMKGRWRSYDSPFSIRLFSRPIHLTLSRSALWIAHRSEAIELPLAAIAGVSRRRGGKVLRLALAVPSGEASQRLRFPSRRECREWSERLAALVGREGPDAGPEGAVAEAKAGWPESRVEPVVLLGRRPGVRVQMLGHVEATGRRRQGTRAGLQVGGAMMGADAVADLQEERLTGFDRTQWRCSGVAIRAVDQEGRRELKLRWFDGQARQLARLMLLIQAPALLYGLVAFGMIVASISSGGAPTARGLGGVARFLWPFALAAGLGLARWPQLLRPAAVTYSAAALIGVVSQLIGALNVLLIVPPAGWSPVRLLVTGSLLGGATLSTLLMSSYWLLYLFAARRAWRVDREFRAVTGADPTTAPLPRRVVGHLALIGSSLFAAGYLGDAGYREYEVYTVLQRARTRRPAARLPNVPRAGSPRRSGSFARPPVVPWRRPVRPPNGPGPVVAPRRPAGRAGDTGPADIGHKTPGGPPAPPRPDAAPSPEKPPGSAGPTPVDIPPGT